MQVLMFVKPALHLLSTSIVQSFHVRQSTLLTTNFVLNKIILLSSDNTYHMRKERFFFYLTIVKKENKGKWERFQKTQTALLSDSKNARGGQERTSE